MNLHIHRPSTTRFQAMVRRAGHKKWVLIKTPTRSWQFAVHAMAAAFASGDWKRGRVVVFADYYDPTVCCEISK